MLKHLVCRHQKPGVLGVESVERDGGLVADIDLEMLGRSREEREIARVQRGGVQHVVVSDEARVDRSLQHQECLCCAWVGVDGEDAADVKVESEVRDTLSVHAWEHIHGCECESSIRATDGRIGSWWNIMDNKHTIDVRSSCMFWHQQYIIRWEFFILILILIFY